MENDILISMGMEVFLPLLKILKASNIIFYTYLHTYLSYMTTSLNAS